MPLSDPRGKAVKRVWALALVFSSACIVGGQGSCWGFTEPTTLPAPIQPIATPTPTPTPTPAPTPTPSPTPVVLNCRVDFLRVTGPSQLLKNETGKYDLTPMQTVDGVSQQVPDPCNEPLASSVEWGLVDRAVAAVVGNGFSATVTRLTATPPIVIRVEFKGVFLEKVIL